MIALVTGGSGGLGSAICRHLAQDGHSVAVGCLERIDIADALAAEACTNGGQALALSFDVADPTATENSVGQVASRFGGLDYLVLAAAHNTNGLLATLPLAEIERMHAVNVTGTINCINSALPHLMASTRGRIVLFSSVLARVGLPGVAGYAATKGAIESLTRSLAVELGPKRITVNAVAPGLIDSGLGRAGVTEAMEGIRKSMPLRRPGEASEVASVVAFLLSEAASYMTGAVLPVDGGMLITARTTARPEAARPKKEAS